MNRIITLTLDGVEYEFVDKEARLLISDQITLDQVTELINEYYQIHPETDPNVSEIPLAELAELFN